MNFEIKNFIEFNSVSTKPSYTHIKNIKISSTKNLDITVSYDYFYDDSDFEHFEYVDNFLGCSDSVILYYLDDFMFLDKDENRLILSKIREFINSYDFKPLNDLNDLTFHRPYLFKDDNGYLHLGTLVPDKIEESDDANSKESKNHRIIVNGEYMKVIKSKIMLKESKSTPNIIEYLELSYNTKI